MFGFDSGTVDCLAVAIELAAVADCQRFLVGIHRYFEPDLSHRKFRFGSCRPIVAVAVGLDSAESIAGNQLELPESVAIASAEHLALGFAHIGSSQLARTVPDR